MVSVLVAVVGTVMVPSAPASPRPAGVVPEPPTRMDAAIERDLHVPAGQVPDLLAAQAEASTVADRLQARLGDGFGGAWLTSDARLTVAVTDARDAATVRAAGATAVTVTYTKHQLDQVKAKLDANHLAAPDSVSQWYVDPPTNSVVVRAQPDQLAAARQFVAASGATGPVRVVASTARPELTSNLRGGDWFHIIGPNESTQCAAGFAVVGGFVTAGHCAFSMQDSLLSPSLRPLGEWNAYEFPGSDMAWAQTDSDFTTQPFAVDIGPVNGSREVMTGGAVCRTGPVTHLRCGKVVEKDVTVNYKRGTVFGLTKTTACSEPGDSGGPYLTGDQAQGVLSGSDGGNCTSGTNSYFQPINPILDKYDLTLKVDWTGWDPVPGQTTDASPAAVTYDGSEYVFVRDTDGYLHVNKLTGTTWSDWKPVPGTGRTPNAPAVTVYNGSLRLFVRGMDDVIWLNSLTGSTWSGWKPVPGGKTAHAPAVTVSGGTLRLFVTSGRNVLWQNVLTGTTWSGWDEVPGDRTTPDGPAAVTYQDDTFLFMHDEDEVLYVNRLAGTTWSGWTKVPGGGTTPSTPGAAVYGGNLMLFARGGKHHIFQDSYDGSWGGWSEVGGGGTTESGPAANVYGNVVHLFVRGQDNQVYVNTHTED